MQVSRVVFLIALMTASAAAQTVANPPPICFAFNGTPTVGGLAAVPVDPAGGVLTVHFTAPTSSTIERVDIPAGGYWGPCSLPAPGSSLYATSALGGPTIGPPLTTFNSPPGAAEPPTPMGSPTWGRLFTPPVSLTAGATYAFVVTGGGCICIPFYYDTAGTTPLTYQLVSGPTCAPAAPTGQLPFSLRFRGTSCGPGPQASMTPHGFGCSAPWLIGAGPPTLGAPWFLNAAGYVGAPLHLFWSVGVNLTGTPVPGTSCLNWLDATSLQSLTQQGLEPLASATVPPMGLVTFVFTIPLQRSLAGTTIGIQGLMISPWGAVPIGGGMTAEITNLVALTLGY